MNIHIPAPIFWIAVGAILMCIVAVLWSTYDERKKGRRK